MLAFHLWEIGNPTIFWVSYQPKISYHDKAVLFFKDTIFAQHEITDKNELYIDLRYLTDSTVANHCITTGNYKLA